MATLSNIIYNSTNTNIRSRILVPQLSTIESSRSSTIIANNRCGIAKQQQQQQSLNDRISRHRWFVCDNTTTTTTTCTVLSLRTYYTSYFIRPYCNNNYNNSSIYSQITNTPTKNIDPMRNVFGSSGRKLFHYSSSSSQHHNNSSNGSTTGNRVTSKNNNRSIVALLSIIGTWYSRQLDTNPILTKSITSGIVSCTGDIICQLLQQNQQQHHEHNNDTSSSIPITTTTTGIVIDYNRIIRFGILGTFIVGPICHYWYGFLGTRLVPATTATSYTNVIKRVGIDQTIFAPIFLILWTQFFQFIESIQQQQTKNGMLTSKQQDNNNNDDQQQSNTASTIRTTSSSSLLQWDDLLQMLYVNWLLWIPAQLLNFKLIPIKYQVLFSNCVAVTWNVYLSYVTSSSTSTKGPHEEKGGEEVDLNTPK